MDKNGRIQKTVEEHCTFPGHSVIDLKFTITPNKRGSKVDYKVAVKRSIVHSPAPCIEQNCPRAKIWFLGLNRDWKWVAHYKK